MFCPNCSEEIRENIIICPSCSKEISQEVVENWKAEIDQVVLGYEEHRGLVHGLQKDAIQNGWGHRLNKKGRNWAFEFHLFEGWDGKWILTMTDIGGYGLTGKNLLADEIPDVLPEYERLARFEHMRFSGGSSQAAGLFGRGKILFTAASKENQIIYDSLTYDGIYRLNRRILKGRKLKNFAKAYEGEYAKKMLQGLTKSHLSPLPESGTRIIIVDPLDNIIDAIHDGSFLRYIGETWWQILLKYGSKIYIKTNDGIREASVPDEFKKTPKKNEGKWKERLRHDFSIEHQGQILKIKKIHFIVAPDTVPLETRGIYLYRRDMKVANLELRDIPPEIEDKFYGYVKIETNSDFEKIYLDEKLEGAEHYSVTLRKGLISKLRKMLQIEFDKFKTEIGFGVTSNKLAEEETRRVLAKTLDELHNKLSKLGISVGKRRISRDLSIRLESIQLPAGKSIVDIDDKITNIKFKIESKSEVEYKTKVRVVTRERSKKEIEVLLEQDITLGKGGYEIIGPLSFKIGSPTYPPEGEILLSCIAKGERDNKTLATRNIPIIINKPPKKPTPIVEMSLNLDDIIFPRGLSNRRVNYEESIKSITYQITSNSPEKFIAKFKARVLDTQTQPKQEIDFLYENDICLEPYKEMTIKKCPDLVVSQEKYKILDREKGKVILRATVVALEDSKMGTFTKGDKLAKQDTSFWVNIDSGKGIFEDYRGWEGGHDEPRSKIQPEGAGYICLLNTTHPAYELLKENGDDFTIDRYAYDELLKQTLILLMETDNVEKWPEVNGEGYKNDIANEELEPEMKIKAFLGTLDYLYGDYFK